MRAYPDILILFLSASIFLILLFALLLFSPRLLKRKETKSSEGGINTPLAAFQLLGNEIKSLKEQLILKERLAALGEVSAGIAHEFKNPMGVIAGYARLLLKSLDEADEKREIARAILKEIEEMNHIMEELLKFSRSEPVNKVETDITKAVRDVIQSMPEIKDRVDFYSADASMRIKGDETLIRQAVKNLLQNSLEAGDRTWVSIESGRFSAKEGVFITVRDNGKGIPEEDLNRIFMPFYTTKAGGSGIGLALVQKIVTGHGGNISVDSREGKGSAFRVFLLKE